MGTRYRVPGTSPAFTGLPSSYQVQNRPIQSAANGGSTVDPNVIENVKRDASGKTVKKRYLKGSLLGKGGFAKCFKVTDLDTKTEWACKIVQKSSLTKQRHKAKLQSEIKIHRSITHPNVVRFEDVFEDKENVYIIMELCPNQSLLDIVKRKKRLNEDDTRRFMLQLLDGVRHMHCNKIIHRDLKLGNIFLGKGDEVKIGDFGLAAKLQFDGERKKTLCGTPNYIAPEVLEGKNGHSFEVDTWSIGVVLYTCLVGKPPFETADVKSTYKLIKSNSYSFPEHVRLSDASKRLIRKILQSKPELRPSIDEILLDEFFLGQGQEIIHKTAVDGSPTGTANSGQRNKIKDALIFSSSASTSVPTDPVRPPLHPVETNNVDSYPVSVKKLKIDGTLSSTGTDSQQASARTRPNSALERNISATSSALSSYTFKPFSETVQKNELSPTKRVTKQLENLDVKTRPSPPKLTGMVRTASKPGSTTNDGLVSAITTTGSGSWAVPRPSTASDAASSASTTSAPSSAREEGAGKTVEGAKGLTGTMKGAPLEDEEALKTMHTNLTSAFASAAQSQNLARLPNLPLPEVWVNKWVDYSKKYGLGYRLSNSNNGVFFNDATKILVSPDGDTFEYIERVRRDDGAKYDTRRQSSLANHGSDLSKKVTLTEHFRNYLDEHRDENGVDSDLEGTSGKGGLDIYVRKWMRTRHSIIFRLSNNAFQVNFLDGTEVFLWSDRRWVTYRSKGKPRLTYDVKDAACMPDVSKRLKYVKEILGQLVAPANAQ